MNLQQLEYIVALYQHGSFAKAAEQCFVTQPTLSMMIKKLEDEIGMIIFERNRNPVEPTEAGLKIIQQAQKILSEVDSLKELPLEFKTAMSGKLKLGIIPTIAPYMLPLILHSFSKKYPEIMLEIQEIKTDEIINYLHKGIIDFGILATPLNNKEILEKKLFIERFFVYTSDKTLLKKKKIPISEIRKENLWLLREGHCLRNQILEICQPKNSNNIQFIAGNLDTIIKLIDFYGGTTIIPEMMIKYLSKLQMKKVIPFDNPVPAREISIVQSKLFIKEHLINAFYDHIIQVMKDELKEERKVKILKP